jgi:hypothetical protein
MLRRLLVLFVVLQFTPMLTELAEWSAHYLAYADFAHAVDHEDEQDGGPDEHGCTPAFHACGCHAPVSATLAEQSAGAVPKPRTDMLKAWRMLGSRDLEQPAVPPPIA